MVDVPRAHELAVWLRFRSQHGAKKGERVSDKVRQVLPCEIYK